MLTQSDIETRRGRISASQIARIVGCSPYGGPYSVWLEVTDRAPIKAETEAQRMGHLLEPVVLTMYEDRVKNLVKRNIGTQVHHERDWQCATPDGICDDRWDEWLVEAKTVAFDGDGWGEDGTEEIPAHYYAQVQWQMSVTGHKRCDVATLFGGREFRIYPIKRNDALIEQLLAAGKKFFDAHVATGIAPPIDGSDAAGEFLKTRFPLELYPLTDAPPEADELIAEYLEASGEAARAEMRKNAAKMALCELMGDCAGIKAASGYVATWKTASAAVDWKAVAEELGATPAIAEKHMKTASRRFHLSAPAKARRKAA